jgi:hypothetical protein
MSKAQKFGIVLILIGVALPTILLGFASTYYPTRGLIWNVQHMKIVLKQRETIRPTGDIFDQIAPDKPEQPKGFTPLEDKTLQIIIPYKYIFALGVVLVFSGIGFITLSKFKKSNE